MIQPDTAGMMGPPQSLMNSAPGSGMGANFAQGAAFAGQAISAIGSAFVQREQQRMVKDAAAFNKKVAMMQAEDQIDRIGRAAQRMRGSQMAAIGASGLAFDGSAIEVIADTMAEFDRDILAVRKSAILTGATQNTNAHVAGANAAMSSAAAAMQLSNTALKAADYYGESLMPKIPTYAGGAAFQGSYSPNLRVNSEQVDAALKQNVETLEGFAQRANKLEANKARAELTKRFGEEQQRMREEWTPDSGDDFVTKAQERYAEIADEYMTNASNKRSRDYMAAEFGDIQGAFVLRDQQYTYKMQSEEAGRQLADGANVYANGAYEGVKPVNAERDFDKMAKDLQVHHDLAEETKRQMIPAIWGSWFYGRIERAKMPGEYDAIYKDITSGEYDDKLTPKQKIELAKLTDSRKKTLVTKRKVTVRKMFDDAFTILTGGGDPKAIGTREEFEMAVASINTGDNPEEISQYNALIDQVFSGIDYAGMDRKELMSAVTDLSADKSPQREGGRAEMADALKQRQFEQKLVSAYLGAWKDDPHGQQARINGDDIEPVDPFNVTHAVVTQRAAEREILIKEQGIPDPPFWNKEDQIAYASAWDQMNTDQRLGFIANLQKQISIDTVEGRHATAEAGEAATGGSVLKHMFMLRDPKAMYGIMKGAGNEPLLRASGDWNELESRAKQLVMGLFDDDSPGVYEDVVLAITTLVAGTAATKISGGKIEISGDLKEEFNKAAKALLGQKIDLNRQTAYFPSNNKGVFIDQKKAREAILNSSSKVILETTGGLHDGDGKLLPDQKFAFDNAKFVIRDEGVLLRLDYASGHSGWAMEEDGKTRVKFDVFSFVDAYESRSIPVSAPPVILPGMTVFP